MRRPTLCCFICTTHRTGSTHFASLLASSLGGSTVSVDEWLLPHYVERRCRAWGVENVAEYLQRLLDEKTSPEGFFGLKIMRNEFERLVRDLEAVHGGSHGSTHELLESWFPELRYIHLKRRDTAAQAVSYARALRTRVWHRRTDTGFVRSGEPETEPMGFDFIDGLRRKLAREDREWQEFFEDNRIAPCRLSYEDLVRRPEREILRVLSFLGLPAPPEGIRLESPYVKLQDRETARWVRRYKRMRPWMALRRLLGPSSPEG